jgi:hypothetical protein
MDTVRFESEPPGADARTSNGQTCRTPCALALPTNAPMSVTFTLNGYQPESENIEPVSSGFGTPGFQPNPVQVELTPAAPPPQPVKKPVAKKKSPAKPTAKPKPQTSTAPAPAATEAAPQQQAPAPWPAAPPPKQ